MAKKPRKPLKVKQPGKLHRELGVPQGKKIPKAKLDAAAKKGGEVGRDARYAKNVLIPGGKTAARHRREKAKKRPLRNMH